MPRQSMAWADLAGVLRDLARVTRPGGELWLYDVWGYRYERAALERAVAPLPLALQEYAGRGPGFLGRWITRVRLTNH